MNAAPCAMVLAGPTASGKSALALALADALPLEIVSVDSLRLTSTGNSVPSFRRARNSTPTPIGRTTGEAL